jgi:hypothetical protein
LDTENFFPFFFFSTLFPLNRFMMIICKTTKMGKGFFSSFFFFFFEFVYVPNNNNNQPHHVVMIYNNKEKNNSASQNARNGRRCSAWRISFLMLLLL